MIKLASYSAHDFDRGAPRWKEVAWIIISNIFFRSPWPFPSALRVRFLRLFGAEVGKGVIIRSGVHITFPWRLTLGDDIWLGEDVRILNLAQVAIESDVCISQQAFLCTGSHDHKRSDFALKTAPINVESSSWIAARSFIGPGVTIKQGTVISANSTRMKNDVSTPRLM